MPPPASPKINTCRHRYASQLLPALMEYSIDPVAEVRQAAVYGVGMVAEHVATVDPAQIMSAAQRMVQVELLN